MSSIFDPTTGNLSNHAMTHILAVLTEGVVILNPHHRVVYTNSALSHMTHFSTESLRGIPADELVHCAPYTYQSFFETTGVQDVTCLVVTSEGKKIPIRLTSQPLSYGEGPLHTLWIINTDTHAMDVSDESHPRGIEGLLGQTKSTQMQHVLNQMRVMAQSDHPVLFVGEKGTGKKSLSYYLHQQKSAEKRPFIALDARAFSEELLERELFGYALHAFSDAHEERVGILEKVVGGTLFLAHIEVLSPLLQRRCIRLIKEGLFERVGERVGRVVQARILFSTTDDLKALVKSGHFYAELYRLLSSYSVVVPPLRQRKEDLTLLISENIRNAQRTKGATVKTMSAEAFDVCRGYAWPGNLSELAMVIDQACFVCPVESIGASHLPRSLWPHTVPPQVGVVYDGTKSKDLSKEELQLILQNFDNKNAAARYLGIERTTLWRWIKKYNLENSFDEREE